MAQFFVQFREGFPEQKLPKYSHCRNGGGSDPCLDFCEGFVHMHWGPSKVIIHHPEVIISKQRTVLKYNNNQFQFIEINYWPLQIFSEFSQQHVTCCWTVMHQMTMFTPHWWFLRQSAAQSPRPRRQMVLVLRRWSTEGRASIYKSGPTHAPSDV